MFGCGLPVAAMGFLALPELVKDGINGMIFNTREQLATQVKNRNKKIIFFRTFKFNLERTSTHEE